MFEFELFVFINEMKFLLILGLLVWVIYPDMKIGLTTVDLWYTWSFKFCSLSYHIFQSI